MIGRILILVVWVAACKGEDPAGGGKAANLGDQVVAVVNGVTISKKEYQSTLAHAARSFSPKPEEKAALAQRVLQKMVADELLIQHARAGGIQVTSEEVDQKLQEIAQAGGGQAALEAFLEQSGLSQARMRANLERNLLIERLAERLRASLRVSPDQVKAYYQAHPQEFSKGASVALAHILFRGDKGDLKERAQKVHAEIQAGLSFRKAVKKNQSQIGESETLKQENSEFPKHTNRRQYG